MQSKNLVNINKSNLFINNRDRFILIKDKYKKNYIFINGKRKWFDKNNDNSLLKEIETITANIEK